MFEIIETDIEIIKPALTILFYIVICIFSIGSALALYSLVRYAKNKFLVIAVTTTYLVIALVLLSIAMTQFNSIKF